MRSNVFIDLTVSILRLDIQIKYVTQDMKPAPS